MSIVLVGLSYKTAPVEIRERLAFNPDHIHEALRILVDHKLISEGIIISTCNRVEVVAATSNEDDSREAISHVYDFIHNYHSCDSSITKDHLYHHTDNDAIRHVFRVTSSLDSMVVGEPQIMGQMKEAFQLAQKAGSIGGKLNKIMTRAFSIAKRVRTETGIGTGASSISSVAVDLARKVFDNIEGSAVMLIGAGEMAELAVKHLLSYGSKNILIVNRTYENAVALAQEMNGTAIPFDQLYNRMKDADIIICSTGANHYLLNQEHVKAALKFRKNKPMMIIDISVPRNADPSIGNLDNAFIFDVDDLKSIADANKSEREREALIAESIVETEIEKFSAALSEGDVNTVIGTFHTEISKLAFSELDKSRKRLGDLSQDQEEAIRIMINAIVNKFTQPVIKQLRESEDGHSAYLSAFKDLYHKKGNRQ